MSNYHRTKPVRVAQRSTEYPFWSILAALALIYLTPFVPVASYGAFAICVYRVVRFDAKVFAADYCLLIPLTLLFRTGGGVTLLIYLCLLAAAWYFIKDGIRGDASYVLLLLLLNYLILRMQLQISRFVLCFGQLFMLCVILPKQDSDSAERAAKLFCVGLVTSSVYALIFRNAWQIRAIRGAESQAIWGTGIMRFQGLLLDPNYYMTMVVLGIAILLKLWDCRRIRLTDMVVLIGCMLIFGVLTYSKTFLVALVLLVLIVILWQFYSRHYFRGLCFCGIGVLLALWALMAEDGIFSVVLSRLLGATNISDLTTGRTDVFLQYLKEITRSVPSFLFGTGLGGERLAYDPHNIYLEITYYSGIVGLGLFIGFYAAMVNRIGRSQEIDRKQNVVARYIVLIMVLVLHFALHGMFQVVTYGDFFVAFLSLKLVRKQEVATQ